MLRASLLFILSLPTYAAIQTLDVTFADGGLATGFIDMPVPLWNTPGNWNIHVTGGAFPAFDYTPANTFSDVFYPNDGWQSVFVQANVGQRAIVLTQPIGEVGLLMKRQTVFNPSGDPMSYELAAGHVDRIATAGCVSDGRACAPVLCTDTRVRLDCGLVQLPRSIAVPVPEPRWLLLAGLIVLGLRYCARWRGV